jgi:hypothetical protein
MASTTLSCPITTSPTWAFSLAHADAQRSSISAGRSGVSRTGAVTAARSPARETTGEFGEPSTQ